MLSKHTHNSSQHWKISYIFSKYVNESLILIIDLIPVKITQHRGIFFNQDRFKSSHFELSHIGYNLKFVCQHIISLVPLENINKTYITVNKNKKVKKDLTKK